MIKNVVLEIGTEEIPSRFIPDALENLKKNAEEFLKNNRIDFKDAKTYATPRRLVLMITNLSMPHAWPVKIPQLSSKNISKPQD